EQGLQHHWAAGYPPMSLEAIVWLGKSLWEIFAGFETMWLTYGRSEPWPTVWAILLAAAGLISWARTNRRALGLIVIPIGLTLLAALLRKYPFADRLILFVVPLMVLAMAEGARFLADRWSK